jgi:ABC-type multidrug transport system fused ATPase/permease subunit
MPLLDLLLAMFLFFIFIAWIWLLIRIFVDIFRSDDISGWVKALWVLFVIVLPFLGVLIYLIARGGKMQERAMREAEQRDVATREYIRSAADSEASTSDEIAKLAQLRDEGTLTEDEFQAQKAKLLA